MEEFARRHGKTPPEALDEAFAAAYLDWEKQDFEEAVLAIKQGYDDVKAAVSDAQISSSRTWVRSMAFRVEVSAQAGRDPKQFSIGF